VPGLWGKVLRYRNVRISFLDEQAKTRRIHATGLVAGMFQHEYDHLLGKLYIDNMNAEQLRNFFMFTEDVERHIEQTRDTGEWNGEWKYLD
jgi:peptide deformylase